MAGSICVMVKFSVGVLWCFKVKELLPVVSEEWRESGTEGGENENGGEENV